MPDFPTTLLTELSNKLSKIQLQEQNLIRSAEYSLNEINSSINLLKAYIAKHKFQTSEEEIIFFKGIKPQFLSKQIYNIAVYNIEIKMPQGGEKCKQKYIQTELDKIKIYFDNNIEFYQYYRAGCTHLDHMYFIRGQFNIQLRPEAFFFEADPKFSTGYDYKVSMIIANDLLQQYLQKKLEALQKAEIDHFSQDDTKMTLKWSESKAALVEVIYALYYQGAIENGKADLKEIAAYFEHMFKVDLGDYYRAFLDIKMRKSGRTKFLDNLKNSLVKYMDEEDDKF